MGGNTFNNGNVEFSWSGSDDEPENDIPAVDSFSVVTRHIQGNASTTFEASSSSGPQSSLFHRLVGMGFSNEIVATVLEENVGKDEDHIVDTLLSYKALPDVDSRVQKESDSDSSSFSDDENVEENLEDEFSDSDFDVKNILPTTSVKSQKLAFLEDMNFPTEEALIALQRCGPEASVEELVDCITAAQMARADDPYYVDPPTREFKKKRMGCNIPNKRQRSGVDEELIRIPKPMIGFGLPNQPCVHSRKLPEQAIGPPYFFYENVALAPKGVWSTISRFLYDVEPEFVDSKFFCAAARKRGYIHNLPIHGRFQIVPPPPLTIHEALPLSRRWWPSWDRRTKLNCLQTCIGSAKLTDRIRKKVEQWSGDPPENVQKDVMDECKKWNLVWVGRNKVAPLEPDEVEMLLGFPRNHTRGGGVSRTDRYKSLGNSFQVDTVAYQLSVLKEIFPNGIKVLSLFSGIGGGEVALHRLGIPLNVVVSVEISEANQNIVRSWWEQTNQKGTLIHINDVQKLTSDKLEELISKFGGFDLLMGGSPCNNLAGSNRVSRDGLEGEHSSLFFDYCRILDLVRCIMARK